MKKYIFALCLCLAIGLVANHHATAQVVKAGAVAIVLAQNYASDTNYNMPGMGKCCDPMVIIWEDGRILFGESRYNAENNKDVWTYSFGKIDPKAIEPLQKSITDSFRIGMKNTTAHYAGWSTFLRTKYEDGYFMIRESHSRSVKNEHVVIIAAHLTKDDNPVRYPEFIEKWSTVKKTLMDIGKEAKTVPVDVDVERYVLTVKKDGLVILRQDLVKQFWDNIADPVEEARQIAIKEFNEYTRRPDKHLDYDIDVTERPTEWSVFFVPKKPSFFGDHAMVWVNKTTGKAQFIPGK
jgi:hypothetical protein